MTAGTVAQLVLTRVRTVAEARTFFGAGSELHLMVRAFLENARHVDLYCMALDDHGSGVAATKTITITGPATADGFIVLYIGGVRIPVKVTNGDVQNSIATAINTAISATPDLPFSNAVATNVVTLTARNKGEAGQDIDVRHSYGEGEALPSGVSAVIATGVTGSQNPLLSAAITALGDEWFQVIAAPYGDATNLTAIETEMASRFGEVRQIPGQYLFAKDANFATMQTFGESRNSPHVRCIDFFGVPWTPFEMAAAWAGVEAKSAQADPAKPLFRNELIGIGSKPPLVADQRTIADKNSLLFSGISPFGISPNGRLMIDRAITMYQKNVAGAEDTSMLRAETMYTLLYMRYDLRTQFASDFAQAKLASDGVFVPPGQSVVTPSIAKAKIIAIARGWERLLLMENIEQFKNDLVVSRSQVDPDRLDALLAPDTINQLVIGGFTMQFIV